MEEKRTTGGGERCARDDRRRRVGTRTELREESLDGVAGLGFLSLQKISGINVEFGETGERANWRHPVPKKN